ncbi:MAG: hypothetical protein BWZ01_03226 [Deltaproteobacteria bacterium ADurb.BinA179]|nr:MAG: hypothetical protein BWZ01_03226 [Deltaproteobacteria bacterium ADurb.BinA179]
MTGTGLKKCVPMTLSGLFVKDAISVRLRPEVLLKNRQCAGTISSSSLNTFFLTSMTSMTTSTTTSASHAASFRSSVGVMRARIASISSAVFFPFFTSLPRFFLMVFMPLSMKRCSMSRRATR